ncbi:LOW QUALITY PROTEIN: hypothetical protein MSG28_007826 [Choristoneura fumiferana]|uniref:Uncharacterized protein n=1 Tax=Choristoneura fumiferana TaxID=7141 RepID=A0ACC0JYX8_CHOFU|nr:LOW QUALITY PROTEIN: hypothetical protein MSG28_007826 [Choristoneura fumiferana]
MLKKIPDDEYEHFWKEYSTNIKLGVMEDPSNRARLAKLLRFHSSRGAAMTFLADYVARMKPGQNHIYYIAGASRAEVERSPFAERLVRSGHEVLYLTEAVDEYCLGALPEYDGKKFQNVAKEIFDLDESDQQKERMEQYKAQTSSARTSRAPRCRGGWRARPAALVATVFGWTGNMERLALSNAHQKADDAQRQHHLSQKKMLEVNPRHPLVRELLRRVTDAPDDPAALRAATALYRTAALRSGFMLQEGQAVEFAESVERMLFAEMGLPADSADTIDDDLEQDAPAAEDDAEDVPAEDHDELTKKNKRKLVFQGVVNEFTKFMIKMELLRITHSTDQSDGQQRLCGGRAQLGPLSSTAPAASAMPATFSGGAGLRSASSDPPTTSTRLPHDSTAYDSGVTRASTLNAAAAAAAASSASSASSAAARAGTPSRASAAPSRHAHTGRNSAAASADSARSARSGDQPAPASSRDEYRCCSASSAAAASAAASPPQWNCSSVADASATPSATSTSAGATPAACRSPNSAHASPAVHSGVVAFTGTPPAAAARPTVIPY